MCQQSVLCEFLSTELESEYQWCGSFSTCQAVMSVPITVKVVVLIPAYMYVRCTKNNFTKNLTGFCHISIIFSGYNIIDTHNITELC